MPTKDGKEVLSRRISIFILVIQFYKYVGSNLDSHTQGAKRRDEEGECELGGFCEESDRGESEGGKKENGGENDG